jgi:hypothetical protein
MPDPSTELRGYLDAMVDSINESTPPTLDRAPDEAGRPRRRREFATRRGPTEPHRRLARRRDAPLVGAWTDSELIVFEGDAATDAPQRVGYGLATAYDRGRKPRERASIRPGAVHFARVY